ncbi:hypothetical protein K1Y72_08485 [Actinomadura sp. PM05-2]|uniref:Abi family protein n=1 Tax=Actinomadura parmotrematis TaxID=2864039 RepID=A0ABS7FQ07_9ACTN|nr:hypothetical protein [Actinomadura parmotrematis]
MLSSPRFGTYRQAVGGDAEAAGRLYLWNVEISGAFYPLLHLLEISSRNALNERLCARYTRRDWWTVAPLSEEGHRLVGAAVGKARRKITREGRRSHTADDVVAELSFGFWVSLLSTRSDRAFWVPSLHRAFPGYSGRRAPLHSDFMRMLVLRNRVMHHEPIHHRNLTRDHGVLHELLGRLSQPLAVQCREFDRVPRILARRAGVVRGEVPPGF